MTNEKMIYVFLADGFEESEAIVPIDILKRAGGNVVTVSISDSLTVVGSHGIAVTADIKASEAEADKAEMFVLPGGGKGTELLAASQWVRAFLEHAVTKGTYIGAICAAPSVLGRIGLLDGRNVTCYPGFESYMENANVTGKSVETDDIFITAIGAGASFEFGFKLAEMLYGEETANSVKAKMMYRQ